MVMTHARGGRLAVGVHYEPSGVDPHINCAELGLQMTMGVFDTLVNKTSEGNYLPGLAESWEISTDQTVYTFRLRRDVRFHDGTPFNAQAVKFSFDRARDPINKSQLSGSMLGPYEHSRVVDDYTVVVHLFEPYALLLDTLSQGWLAPVSPSAVAKYGADFGLHLVGTGPFTFVEWIRGDRITLRRNPDYSWAPPVVKNRGVAHLDEITFKFLPKDSDRVAALQEGETDGIFYVPPTDVARLRENPALQVQVWPIRGVPVSMMMNVAKSPTDDPAVRKAISHALDRDALVKEVFNGEFPRAYGPLSQATLAYNPIVEQMYPFSLEQARALLSEAGWSDVDGDGVLEKGGEELKLVFLAIPFNYYVQFGEIVKRQLRAIGADVEVRVSSAVEWLAAAQRGEHHLVPQGKFASAPQIVSYVYHSKYSPDGYGWTKRSAEYPAGLDDLLERGERALDKSEYVPLYRKAQEIIMDEALAAPLHCNTNIIALRKGVRGLLFDAIGSYPFFHDTILETA